MPVVPIPRPERLGLGAKVGSKKEDGKKKRRKRPGEKEDTRVSALSLVCFGRVLSHTIPICRG